MQLRLQCISWNIPSYLKSCGGARERTHGRDAAWTTGGSTYLRGGTARCSRSVVAATGWPMAPGSTYLIKVWKGGGYEGSAARMAPPSVVGSWPKGCPSWPVSSYQRGMPMCHGGKTNIENYPEGSFERSLQRLVGKTSGSKFWGLSSPLVLGWEVM